MIAAYLFGSAQADRAFGMFFITGMTIILLTYLAWTAVVNRKRAKVEISDNQVLRDYAQRRAEKGWRL